MQFSKNIYFLGPKIDTMTSRSKEDSKLKEKFTEMSGPPTFSII